MFIKLWLRNNMFKIKDKITKRDKWEKAIALSRQAIDNIKTNPQSWNQGTWHCNSTHCYAGHCDLIIGIPHGWINTWGCLYNDIPKALGLSDYRFRKMTSWNNTIENLERMHQEYIVERRSIDSDGYDAQGIFRGERKKIN